MEEADKLSLTWPRHNGSGMTKPYHRVEHPAQYAYKCACGATK